MSGGGQQGTSTTTSGPPSYLAPYVTSGAQQAQGLYNTGGAQYYPGSQVAAQSPFTQAAGQGIAAAATNGNPALQAGTGFETGLLNGNYLNPGNPYQANLNKSISDSVIPQVESQFNLAGRSGSPSEMSEMTRQLADAIAPSEYQNYGNTLGLMNTGASWAAPSLNSAQYTGLDQLASFGQGQDQYNQSLINAPMQKWNYNQNLPFQNLAQYMGLLGMGGGYGNNQTTTTSAPGGGVGGLLGGLFGGIL